MLRSLSELPPLVGLCGYMGSGKNTVAAIMSEDYGYVSYGFADALKDLAHRIGWDGTKRPHAFYGNFGKGAYNGRLLLQELGVGAREVLGREVWVNALFARISNDLAPRAVITDVRFPNEAEAIRAHGGIVLRVVRKGYNGDGHASEREVERIPVDGFILNDGLESLRNVVAEMLRSELVP